MTVIKNHLGDYTPESVEDLFNAAIQRLISNRFEGTGKYKKEKYPALSLPKILTSLRINVESTGTLSVQVFGQPYQPQQININGVKDYLVPSIVRDTLMRILHRIHIDWLTGFANERFNAN